MRYMFTCQPVGPHLQPHAPLIRALQEQGHEVILATPDKLAQMARHYGITHVPAGEDWTTDPAIRGETASLLLEQGNDAYNRAAFRHLANGARSMAPDLLEIARAWTPDVIVTDISEFGGYLVGKMLGIPVVTSDNGLLRLVKDLYDPVMRPIINEVAREMGLPPEPEGMPGSFETVLHPLPKQILLPDLELPGLVTFRKEPPRSIGARLPNGVFETDQQKLVVMYGSTGSSVPQWREIFEHSYRITIDALRDAPYDVFMSVGKGNVGKYADLDVPEEQLGLRAVPARGAPNIKVVAYTGALPQAFEQADAAGLHAGFGSYTEAAAAGVVVWTMPNQTDQPDNGERIEAAGLGLNVPDPREATARDVRETVDQLMEREDEFRANMARLREDLTALPAVGEITGEITRSLELGDLEFRGLKEPPAGPEGAPGEARQNGPIVLTGPAGSTADEPEVRQAPEAPEASEAEDPPERQPAEPEATEELAEPEVGPEDSPVGPEVLPVDSPVGPEVLPVDSPVESEVLPVDPSVESEVLPVDSSAGPVVGLEDLPVGPEVLPVDSPAGPVVGLEDLPVEAEVGLEDPPVGLEVGSEESEPVEPEAQPEEPEELDCEEFDGP